ncbi:MAG: DEAD/DEAH box helicase [Candidatus Zixiibacteriota bacterium]
MRLEDLEKYGIPGQVISRLAQRQGQSLLPVQSRAIRKGLIGNPGEAFGARCVRMLVSSPTSSGKSFCAEIASMKALTARQKTVMLFPLKSLAEQKYELLSQTYGDLGIRTIIVTGDHPENDERFYKGDYQIAVAIYEKFDLLLTRLLDSLKNIGLVVIDEIQTITEPGRGAILERLLTKILASGYNPSLLGLSAVIGDDCGSAGKLAAWLRATLIEETTRPVELMRGVAAEGSFRYRLFNDGLDGVEPFEDCDAGDERFEQFVRQIKKAEGSTLVFLKSRMETVDCAFRLAASVNWPEATAALVELDDEEPSFLVRSLKQALTRGVAFHSSDLSPRQRTIVEQAFINKEIKALFSTTTLAMGVNLSADTVYLETVKYSSGKYDQRPSLVPVSRSDFDNMSGRAGRLIPDAKADHPGRAIILAETEFDREILWQNYIACDSPQAIRSAFESVPAEDWLLDMIACGLIRQGTGEALGEPFNYTFLKSLDKACPVPDFTASLQRLIHSGLVEMDALSGKLTATALGQATARGGLSVEETVHYRRALDSGYPDTPAGWIALALSGHGWSLPPAILSRFEQTHNLPLKMLYADFDNLVDEAVRYLAINRKSSQPLPYRQAASIKALMLLEQWRQLTPVEKLEERFQMHLGQIIGLAESIAHLMTSLGEIVRSTDGGLAITGRLKDYAFNIRYGVPVSMRSLHEHFGRILNRFDFAALRQAKVESVDDLFNVSPDNLGALIKGSSKLKKINDIIAILKGELEMEARTSMTENRCSSAVSASFVKPESIEIDGSYERERYLVKINGFPVRLTGKSFKYFTKLAWSRLNRDSGWIYKEDIEVGFNQARYLYRMKGEISAGLNSPWPVVENNRLGYYRLSIDPSRIRVNVNNLKNHPDWEVRSLVADKDAGRVN